MKTFDTKVVKKITIDLKVKADTFDEARKMALEQVHDWNFTGEKTEYYIDEISIAPSIQRKKDIVIGEDMPTL